MRSIAIRFSIRHAKELNSDLYYLRFCTHSGNPNRSMVDWTDCATSVDYQWNERRNVKAEQGAAANP